MRNRGAALYRDVMYERVWGGIPDTESLRTVDTHIARLRKKARLDGQDRDSVQDRVSVEEGRLNRERQLRRGRACPARSLAIAAPLSFAS